MANPYRADIDINTAEGRKLWNKATEGLDLDNCYDLSQEKIHDFKEALDKANSKFAWGGVINAIPLSHDAQGQVLETASLLAEPNRISMEQVIDFAEEIWGNTNGDRRIDMNETDPIMLQ